MEILKLKQKIFDLEKNFKILQSEKLFSDQTAKEKNENLENIKIYLKNIEIDKVNDIQEIRNQLEFYQKSTMVKN